MSFAFQWEKRHLVKAGSKFRILLDLFENHVRHFCDARNKELNIPLFLVLRILPVIFHNTVVGCVCQELRNALFRLAGELCDFCGGLGLAQAHLQHDFGNLITGAGAVQNDVFGIVLCQPFEAEFVRQAVGDHFAKVKQNLSCHRFSPFGLFVIEMNMIIDFRYPSIIHHNTNHGSLSSKK